MAISGVALQSPALVGGYPIDTYFSAYRPIQWGWAFVASAGEELTNLVVTVYNSATGQPITKYRNAWRSRTVIGINTLFYFLLDVSAAAQTLVAPFGGTQSSTFTGFNTQNLADIYITVQAEYKAGGSLFITTDPTIYSTELEPTKITNSASNADLVLYPVGAGGMYFGGVLVVGQFWGENGQFSSPYFSNWLSDIPAKGNLTCSDYKSYLAYTCPNTSFYVVEVTKPDGTVTTTTVDAFAAGLYIHVPTDVFTLNDLYTLGIAVGDTYTVQIKCVVGVLAGFTPAIEYKVVECCDPYRKGIALSFMNKYGVADTVLLSGEIARTQSAKSETAAVPLLHNQTTHAFEVSGAGSIRYNVSAEQGFEVACQLTNKQAMWLRDLLRSPEAYYNIPYSMRGWIERQSVVIDDVTQKVSQSGTGLIDFSFSCRMANADIVQIP
jgi:hypothetical protein